MQYPNGSDNYDVNIFNSNFQELATKKVEGVSTIIGECATSPGTITVSGGISQYKLLLATIIWDAEPTCPIVVPVDIFKMGANVYGMHASNTYYWVKYVSENQVSAQWDAVSGTQLSLMLVGIK